MRFKKITASFAATAALAGCQQAPDPAEAMTINVPQVDAQVIGDGIVSLKQSGTTLFVDTKLKTLCNAYVRACLYEGQQTRQQSAIVDYATTVYQSKKYEEQQAAGPKLAK